MGEWVGACGTVSKRRAAAAAPNLVMVVLWGGGADLGGEGKESALGVFDGYIWVFM